MPQKTTSIFLPLLLLAGVANAYITGFADEDGNILRPFVSNSQRRRICVDLCLSGLGGTPCGDECADITPLDMPVRSIADTNTSRQVENRNITRDSSCSVLCSNNLGRPLCQCDAINHGLLVTKSNEADFMQICSFFCENYDYKLRGCQKCSVFKHSVTNVAGGGKPYSMFYTKFETSIDWHSWCLEKCSRGDGGVACNCDRLPLKK